MAIERHSTAKVYNFKSVGTTMQTQQKRSLERQAPPPVGIKTPVALAEEGTNFLQMNTTFVDQIHDNLINLILTNHGERLGLPSFGANLMELTMEMQDEDGQAEAMSRISQAVLKWMPYVVLETFSPVIDRFNNQDIAKIGVSLTYSVPRLNSPSRGLEVILYSSG